MKLLCYLKSSRANRRPILLHESDNLDDLKFRAVEYANTNPSFRADWSVSDDHNRQELEIELDYRLEIQA